MENPAARTGAERNRRLPRFRRDCDWYAGRPLVQPASDPMAAAPDAFANGGIASASIRECFSRRETVRGNSAGRRVRRHCEIAFEVLLLAKPAAMIEASCIGREPLTDEVESSVLSPAAWSNRPDSLPAKIMRRSETSHCESNGGWVPRRQEPAGRSCKERSAERGGGFSGWMSPIKLRTSAHIDSPIPDSPGC